MEFSVPPGGGNPARAEANWPPVVVGGAFQTGLNLMRDLLRRGVRAVAIDYDLTHQGFRSVYGKTHHCPNPDTDSLQWLAFMKQLSGELGQKPVFIPAADAFIGALARYAPELTEHYLNSPDAARLQAELSSKETQYALCAQHGYPCPRLAYIQSRTDLDRFLNGARFPCLIKPRSPREWDSVPAGNPAHGNKIVIAQTASELERVYDALAPYRPEAIAQEVIAGLGNQKRVYMSVFGAEARLLGHCLVKEFRPYPVFTGMPPVVQPIEDDRLTELCGNFLQKIGYRGICEFEFKLDDRDGEPRLIEINPRFSGTGDSASYMGVETGWLHYLDVIGYPVTPVKPLHFDFYHIALKIEASDTPPYVLNKSIPWGDFLTPYRGRKAYFDLDWHDRRLARATVLSSARYVAGAIWRHVRGISKPA
jgi:predicted ATP-grasp superfamily ATP-dependent carboligase